MAEPSTITLEDALKSVGNGLKKLQRQDLKTGLIVSEVDVTFNITASSKDSSSGKIYVEAGASVAKTLEVTKVGAEAGFSSELSASRGNTITIKFRNLLGLSTKDTVAGALGADALKALTGNIKPFVNVPIETK